MSITATDLISILGIDIAKATFHVALLHQNNYKHKTFENNTAGFNKLSDWLSGKGIIRLHACLEATGIYGEKLSQFLYQAGFTVSVVNPAKIKGFAQCQLMRLKTDKADAEPGNRNPFLLNNYKR